MTTQICINSNKGQDCLLFQQSGQNPGKSWELVHVQSKALSKKNGRLINQPAAASINQGPFYVSQSAFEPLV